ncbi:MAG: hypothetical protein ACI9WS_001165 [Paraglaciecola psychrophila]|jgi:hypothetical protein
MNILLTLLDEEDKRKHSIYSFFILVMLSAVFGLTVSVVLTALIGLGKEIWDHYYGSGFCWRDMAANGIGITAGLIVAATLFNGE